MFRWQLSAVESSSAFDEVVFWMFLIAAAATVLYFIWRAIRDQKSYSSKGSFSSRSGRQSGGAGRRTSGGAQKMMDEDPEKVREEFESLLLELREFVSESMAKLDTKVRFLNKLIMEAEEKIQRLEALQDQDNSRSQDRDYSTGMSEGKRETSTSSTESAASHLRNLQDSEDEKNTRKEPDREESEKDQEDDLLENKPMYKWVWRLSDQGLGRGEVAEKTGLDEAEIDVILGLRDVQD